MSINADQLASMLSAPGSYGYLCAVDPGDDWPFFCHTPIGHTVARVTPAHREAMLRRAHLTL